MPTRRWRPASCSAATTTHYSHDRGYEGTAEADYFINAFKPYIGKAILFLDWEADALNLGPS